MPPLGVVAHLEVAVRRPPVVSGREGVRMVDCRDVEGVPTTHLLEDQSVNGHEKQSTSACDT